MKKLFPLGWATFALALAFSADAHAANFVVTNNSDGQTNGICEAKDTNDGCSLREAVDAANNTADDDTITFDADAFGAAQTITLGGTALSLNDNGAISIDGSTTAGVTIDGNNQSGVFTVTASNAALKGLTITRGGGAGSNGNIYYSNGGGISNQGTLTLSNSTITGNSSNNYGGGGIGYNSAGGISNQGTLTVNDSTITGNSSNGYGGLGGGGAGGISNRGTLTINRSTIANNSSAYLGGGIYNQGTLTIGNSTINNNSATYGAGIFNNSTLTLNNSTIANNTSSNIGGAIYSGGQLTIVDSTIAGNSAGSSSGGLYSYSSLAIANSIVAGNTAPNANNVSIDGSSTFDVSDYPGNVIDVDPLLGELQDNGGPTFTMLPLEGSPAIDQGNAASGALDQRGLPRGFDDLIIANADNGSDIGAVEVQDSYNVAPVVSALSVDATEDATFAFAVDSFDAAFSDSNKNNALKSVRIVSLPAAASGVLNYDGQAATAEQVIARADLDKLSFAPAADFNGAVSFDYNASDGALFAADNATLTLAVAAVNDAPSFTLAGNQKTVENSGFQRVEGFVTSFSAGPDNESEQSLRFEVKTFAPELFSRQPVINTNGNLTYTPAPNAVGVAVIKVKAVDSGGTERGGIDTSAGQLFSLTIAPAPIDFVVRLKSRAPQTNDTLTATPSILPEEGMIVRYEWFVNGVRVRKNANNTFDLSTPGYGDAGDTVSVLVTVRNARGGVGTATNSVRIRGGSSSVASGIGNGNSSNNAPSGGSS